MEKFVSLKFKLFCCLKFYQLIEHCCLLNIASSFSDLIILCLNCPREIDFVTEMVRTLAGNGTKGSDYTGGGKGMDQASSIL